MRLLGCLLTLVFVGVCLGAEKEPAGKSQAKEKEAAFGGKTVSEWIALTKDKEQRVRFDAAWALWKLGPKAKSAVPAIAELLKDKDEQVRQAAVGALGSIGPEAKAAVPALTELLREIRILALCLMP